MKRMRTGSGQPNNPPKLRMLPRPQQTSQPHRAATVFDLPNQEAIRSIIRCVLGNRTSEQWIAQYSSSHRHPINRACHTLGIPIILISLAVFVAAFFFHRLWLYALALFVIGWVFQFIGHAVEGKPPEFFHDWRFLFVGVRWWWAKINGRA